jgi:hypothetical protein
LPVVTEGSLMTELIRFGAVICLALPLCPVASAQAPQTTKDGLYFPSAVIQTEADEYTRYELLGPESASFRIYYEVTATTAGAKVFYNPIRKGC